MANQNHPYDLFEFFKRTPDLVCIAGRDGYFRQVNPSVIQKLGYTEAELYSRPVLSFLHPEDLDRTVRTRERMLQGESLVNFQNRYIHCNGSIVWLEWTSIYVPEREVVFAIAKDITARKGIDMAVEEEHRRYRGLASHLKTSIEIDRKFVATELHEELAQLILALKLNIDWVRRASAVLSPEARERMDEANRISDQLISTVRRVSFAMSPHMIDDLGLNATLEWHCREFTVLHRIPCHYFTNVDTARLGKEIQVDFFRICQAALDNVRKHSRARSATVKLEGFTDKLRLSIADNGVGFDPLNTGSGMGLQTIYNRAISIGGKIDIDSGEGRGTLVAMEWHQARV